MLWVAVARHNIKWVKIIFLMLRFTIYGQSDYPVNHAYRTTPQQTPVTLLLKRYL